MPESKQRTFDPPPFEPHRLIRGGHLQTILSITNQEQSRLAPTQHVVPVSDGDSIVLYDDLPPEWNPDNGSMLMIHGLSGCHQSPYMIRLAHRLVAAGFRVFRVDMRSAGAAAKLSENISHSGRSDDVIAALSFIADRTAGGPLMAMGVSLGGHQLLRATCRIGAGEDTPPDWFDRLTRIAAVAPPLNLPRCAANMLRISRRPYNRYFIRQLLVQAPPRIQAREEFRNLIATGRPKTLYELDDRMTAPMSGFDSADDYYEKCTVHHLTAHNPVPTLVLAASDDPIVPVANFTDPDVDWPATTTVHLTHTGGHVGFIDHQRRSWMDRAILQWFT